MGLLRKLALVALVAAGAFLLSISVAGYSGLGPEPPLATSVIMISGILSLVTASVVGLASVKLIGPPVELRNGTLGNSSLLWVGLVAAGTGIAFIISAMFIVFPVGCNLATSCPADPTGTWSTIWPNVLTLSLGVVLAVWGFGNWKSEGLSLPGLGIGWILSGIVLIVFGVSIGYFTSCPANGCPSLTGSEWWSLFWPDVTAEIIGALLVIAGSLLVFLAWPKQVHAGLLMEPLPPRKADFLKDKQSWRLTELLPKVAKDIGKRA